MALAATRDNRPRTDPLPALEGRGGGRGSASGSTSWGRRAVGRCGRQRAGPSTPAVLKRYGITYQHSELRTQW